MADNGPFGPFETEDDARMTPAVRATWETLRAGNRRGVMDELNLRRLDEACALSGIGAGAYGHRILAWLANMEPQTCEVFADLIIRAHESGKAAAPERSAAEWGVRFTMSPGDRVESEVSSEDGARTAVANMRDKHPEFDAVLVRRVAAIAPGDWEDVPDA